MTHDPKFRTPSQAEIDRVIAQARQMRSAYMAKWIQQGLSTITQLFARGHKPSKVAG